MDPAKKKLCIIDSSFLLPGFNSEMPLFQQFIRKTPGDVKRICESVPCPESSDKKEVRRMSKLTRLAAAASEKISISSFCDNLRCGLSIGLTHGSTILLLKFLDYLFDYGPEMASPNAFSNGVTNATLGAVSRQTGISSEGITVMGNENCGVLALEHAWQQIKSGMYEMCLVGGAEEYLEKKEEVYKKAGWYCGEKTPEYLPFVNNIEGKDPSSLPLSEGSAFFLVTTPDMVSGIDRREMFTAEIMEDPLKENAGRIDLVISGAAGGPQDRYELETIKSIVSKGDCSPALFFPKLYTGEIFAVSSMSALITAMDIIDLDSDFSFGGDVNPGLEKNTDRNKKVSDIKNVLVLSCTRSGEISSVVVKKEKIS